MILISHRGNTSGPAPSYENHPDYLREALIAGYECEVDVWYKDDEWWLGHDEPVYDISKAFLQNNKLWCHAKNLEALHKMLQNNIHCFWHQEDDYTLTSKGFVWTYPGKPVCKNSIIVCYELPKEMPDCLGICSDYLPKGSSK